jgi:excisionase family DNA binding protein
MSESREFFSFEEALRHLRLKDEELKRLVSEGEIRAFRDGETMKLRRQDVEHLARELLGGEEIELGDTAEDLLFEDDADLETADAGMATQELSAADTLLAADDLLEEEDVDEEEELAEEDAPALQPVGAGEESSWTPLSFALVLVTTLILVLTGPLLISLSSDHASDMAKAIGGLVVKFDEGGG